VKALLGDYPVTKLFKQQAGFDFADVKLPQHAFKRVVRDLEFDFAELALVTYLLAKAHGKPYRLLPAVLTARFQHAFLVGLADRKIDFKNLKRIGQRSYSVTTATWVRGILADDYGVDLHGIRWVTFEDPHVVEFRDPPNVERAAPGKDMTQMLLAGELDAAIVGEVPKEGSIQPLIKDLDGAAAAWRKRTGASIQVNHMVVIRSSMDSSSSNQILELLRKSREAAGNPPANPFGIEDNRRNLEAAIDCVFRQNMIPRRFTVEELFQ
jgi:4,5-dihydroxyphthalate decarboxylase